MSSPDPGGRRQQIFIWQLSTEAAVDLIVTSADPSTAQQSGLRIRAFNDEIPVAVLPSACTRIAPQAMDFRLGNFSVDLNESVDIEVVAALLQDQQGGTALIAVPRIGSGYERIINIRVKKGPGEAVMLGFADVIGVSVGGAEMQASDITSHRLTIGPGHTTTFYCLGSTRVYGLALWPISTQPAEYTLRRDLTSGAIHLVSGADGPAAQDFALGIIPVLGERLMLGDRTASLVESPFAYVIYPPLGPGNLQWIACLLHPGSVPLSYSSRVANRYPVPYIGFATDDGNWVLGTNQPEGSMRELAVCLVGRPEPDDVKSLVESQSYRRIYVITDDEHRAASYLDPFGATIATGMSDKFTMAQTAGTRLGVAITDWTAASLEAVNVQLMIVELAEERYTDFYRQSWRSVINDRLPRVPVVPDPRVGSMCVLINLIRGRVPDATEQALDDWSSIFANGTWLVPWENPNDLDVEQLSVELIARSASEYVALQHVGAMMLEQAGPEPGAPVPANVRHELERLFDARIRASPLESPLRGAQLRDGVLRARIGRHHAASIFAEYIYRMDPNERHAAGMAFTNPFVIALVEKEKPWYQLAMDLAYWTIYAACCSRTKVGAIMPLFTTAAEVAQLKSAMRSLRIGFHDLDNPRRVAQIREHRRRIGQLLAAAIGPSVRQALERVGTDRFIAFSDAGLEYLPYGNGVLGMEVPLSRLPASWPAMITVGNAVRSATTGQSAVRGGPLTAGSRAVIIAAERETDVQTRWSRHLADAVKERVKWVGLIAEVPHAVDRPARDLLASCAEAAVVMFFGHASASGRRAGLSLGDGNAVAVPDVLEFDWSGKLVILVGCETSAQDAEEFDIASAFLRRGARAVVGTSAKVSVRVADYLFGQLLQLLIDGMPIDYAFFLARRRTAAFETLRTILSTAAATDRIAAAVARGAERGPLSVFLNEIGLQWSDIENDGIYAPTFSLLGGAGETLV